MKLTETTFIFQKRRLCPVRTTYDICDIYIKKKKLHYEKNQGTIQQKKTEVLNFK